MKYALKVLIMLMAIGYVHGMEKVEASEDIKMKSFFMLGEIAYRQKKYEEAEQYFRQVAEQARDKSLQGKALKKLGDLYCECIEGAGTYEQSFTFYERSSREEYDDETRLWSYLRLAELTYFGLGCEKDSIRQKEYAKKAYDLAKKIKGLDDAELICGLFTSEENAYGSIGWLGIPDVGIAALCGLKKVIENMISEDADITAVDNYGCTCLHYATRCGHRYIVELLLDRGADINAVSKDGCTCLHLATAGGHREVVELLLDRGADIKAVDKEGWTCLHYAAKCGHREVIELLLDKGVDMKAVDKDGCPCLHMASLFGDKDVVELLLDRGADIEAFDKGGRTCLHWAAVRGRRDVVELLLDRGAHRTAKDNTGKFPVDVASSEELKKLLL